MCGRQMSTSTSAPTPEIRCVRIRRLASGVMNNIMAILEYLRYRRQETVHNKSTTLCREWDSHYNINAQTHVQTSLRHRHHIANQLDRIQREATVATNLRASVTACTHSDNIPDYAARSRHINWAVENSVATSPRRQTSQIRRTLLLAHKAVLVLN